MARGSTLLLVIIFLWLRAGAALANCDPEIDYSVRGEFDRSAYVGVVRVRSVTWLDEQRRPEKLHGHLMLGTIPGGFDPYSGANYRVTIERSLKGAEGKSLTIFSENTEARTPMRIGKRYLVFLKRQTSADDDDRVGDLMIDYCGNSATLAAAGRAISIIDHASEYDRLEGFLRGYIGDDKSESGGPSRYAAALVDLNGDGRLEAVVYLSGGNWCGSGGCVLLVLARQGDSYRVVTKTTVTQLPIRLLPHSSHGWRDLSVFARGGGIRAGHQVKLAFDGERYPSNPTVWPAQPVSAKQGREIMSENDVARSSLIRPHP